MIYSLCIFNRFKNYGKQITEANIWIDVDGTWRCATDVHYGNGIDASGMYIDYASCGEIARAMEETFANLPAFPVVPNGMAGSGHSLIFLI